VATYRRPKGSYTRPTTDFFIDRCVIAGVWFTPALTFGGSIELYNNAADGSNLHLYRLWTQNDAAGGYYVTRQTGTQGGTAVQTFPVISSGAALPGIVNYAAIAGTAYPLHGPFVLSGYMAMDNEAGSQDTFGADGPLCILVPGDSLRVIQPFGSAIDQGTVAATFYWAAIRDTG